MHREGHIGAALTVYSPFAFLIALAGTIQLAVFSGVVVIGLAMIPDYDMRIPFVEHRGHSHTIWVALLVGMGLMIAGGFVGLSRGIIGMAAFAVLGFIVGVVTTGSHIMADALTPMGVKPFAGR